MTRAGRDLVIAHRSKKRSGKHESCIREFIIRDSRLVVGEPLTDFHGILRGVPDFLGGSENILKSNPEKG